MGHSHSIVDDCFRLGRSSVERAEREPHCKKLQPELAEDIVRVPFLRYNEYLPDRTEFDGFSWSDGVHGTIPVWSMGKVREARR